MNIRELRISKFSFYNLIFSSQCCYPIYKNIVWILGTALSLCSGARAWTWYGVEGGPLGLVNFGRFKKKNYTCVVHVWKEVIEWKFSNIPDDLMDGRMGSLLINY